MPVESREELERLLEALKHPNETPVSWRIGRLLKEYVAAYAQKGTG